MTEWSEDAERTLEALEKLGAACHLCGKPVGSDPYPLRIGVDASSWVCEWCYYESGSVYICEKCDYFVAETSMVDIDDASDLYMCEWCQSKLTGK